MLQCFQDFLLTVKLFGDHFDLLLWHIVTSDSIRQAMFEHFEAGAGGIPQHGPCGPRHPYRARTPPSYFTTRTEYVPIFF
jgi:hypothetical protein